MQRGKRVLQLRPKMDWHPAKEAPGPQVIELLGFEAQIERRDCLLIARKSPRMMSRGVRLL
jgi:hypothetical protein